MKRSMLALTAIVLCAAGTHAQSYQSRQPHDGAVTAIAVRADEQAFYTAGSDGFLVRWDNPGQGESKGERYQVSDIPIALMAGNPDSNDVAVYESNGLATNRVAVYDWNTFGRRFAKRFKSSVICLSYSAKGSYLFVGTSAVNGMYILSARTGDVLKNIKTIPGVITMARTGDSEKTAIMYSPSGYIYYWDIKKGNVKLRFPTEASLEQPCLFGSGKFQNRFFAGVKANTIYVIDATTGKTLASYNATNPMLASCGGDYEEGLFYISDRGRGYSLSLISSESLADYLTQAASGSLPSSSLVKNFMGLKDSDSFATIAKNQESVILGTKEGDIYSFSDIKESETYSLEPITQGKFGRVSDLCSEGTDFYALAAGKIYRADFNEGSTEELAGAPAGTDRMAFSGKDIILWTEGSRSPVHKLSPGDGKSEILFTPSASISKVRLTEKGILYVKGNNSVCLYDMGTGKNTDLYSGSTIEDAALVGDTLYVAKSASGANDSALMSVNLKTKETVPIKMDGTVAFSLSHTSDGASLYGVEIENKGNDEYLTQIFAYDTTAKTFRFLLKLNNEDSSARTQLKGDELFTNIGRTQVYAYNLRTNKCISYRRSASLPVKAVSGQNLLAVLNNDGSISWYSPRSKQQLAIWHISDEGEWESD